MSINANAFWVNNQHVVDYEVAFNIERELNAELTALRAENAALKEWKESAMIVMPDFQAIGQALNVPLGESVHDKILTGIQSLKSSLLALQQAVAVKDRALEEISTGMGPYSRDPLEHATNVIEKMMRLAMEALSLSPDSTLMGRVVEVLKDAEQDYLFPGTIDQLPIVTEITKILDDLGVER